jgi:hypothetical protein
MKYTVTYALAHPDPYQRTGGTFVSRTDINNLKMVVEAGDPSQACRIVESMFGGSTNCRAANAFPIY